MNDGFAQPQRLLNPNATVSPVVYGDDKMIFAEFYDEPVYSKPKSATAGRPIYDTVVMCKIIFPGDRTKSFIEKVKMVSDEYGPSHPERFPRQWAAYQAQHEQVPDGMPVEQWPPISKARCKELKAMHVHTVEMIAGMSDQNGPSIGMDWRTLRDMAQATLKPGDAAVEISKLHKQLADLQSKFDAREAAEKSVAASKDAQTPRKKGFQPGPDLTTTED